MAKDVETLIATMRANPRGVRFAELVKVCEAVFGAYRVSGSHHVFKTPWPGDPRLNVQNDKGKAKAYQVAQVLRAIDKIRGPKTDEGRE